MLGKDAKDKTIIMSFQKNSESNYNYAIPNQTPNSQIPQLIINQTFEQKNLLKSKNGPLQT